MCGSAAVPNIMQNVSARKLLRFVARSFSPASPVLVVGYGVACGAGGTGTSQCSPATCAAHAAFASSGVFG